MNRNGTETVNWASIGERPDTALPSFNKPYGDEWTRSVGRRPSFGLSKAVRRVGSPT